ncbi:MAG: Nucleoside diphosphate kinase [Candidatus Moranbacteria bacterium GW2011_GWE2_35_2-]|nr:MAG: Nucleoside diphosphate kinase [Candidatus Moranbacteria bacterium GW2011_GWE2_35_2-]KKQ04826.1 MAG: Nucleoside diphosphate kinase [Candidatus Moranbacteria bacterium GW2011_GWF1_36_4]KKQ21891.1 MAG: Nucleoside diphosphate kinase [Candidatus Moranbacteria bacterium GW2011_GWF2_37_11]KKQ29428.1 MAG: Nucleoside diphosphate kinase [Candidatus Moranbacteria bacterium GW2011_GWD1_37_17]KKQ30703.1 MAG: Nucleoside diphosphate kinase [Candidatus Moranbacteria bacterium GW2011_GWE1_37_24]KKQ4700
MEKHPKNERTLVIIKPDGIQRSLVGEIIKRYERVGLKLVAMKMMIPTEDMAVKHYYDVGGDAWLEEVGRKARAAYEKKGMTSPYATNMENGKAVMMSNAKYLSAGPVVAMIWQGNQACALVRKITGGTEPLTADLGSIRSDFTLDTFALADTDQRSVRNLLHASGNPEEAEKEIPIWFAENEILKYKHIQEAILYDVNLDGILE